MNLGENEQPNNYCSWYYGRQYIFLPGYAAERYWLICGCNCEVNGHADNQS